MNICPRCGGELVRTENPRKLQCFECGRVYIAYIKKTKVRKGMPVKVIVVPFERYASKVAEAMEVAELIKKGDREVAAEMIRQHFNGSFLDFLRTLVVAVGVWERKEDVG